MRCSLSAFEAQGCRFLVAGRVDAAGHFRGLDELPIPPQWRGLFEAIPADAFRLDISSSQIRAARTP
jgi:hypothetical protein